MSTWYYSQDGQSMGPVTVEVIQGMLAQGTLKPHDLVWRDGMQQWAAIQSIPEFAGAAPAPSYPAQQPAAFPQQNPYAQQGPYAQPMPGYGYGQPGVQPGSLNYFAPTWQVAYAGFWKRFAAALLDGLILMVVMVPFVLIIFAIVGFDSLDDPDTAIGLDLGIRGIGIFAGWLYGALMESSKYQATLGKMALGIKVTDMQGQPITFGRASGRHFGKIISACICYVGFMMAGWTAQKQSLHDQMAGCLVVNK